MTPEDDVKALRAHAEALQFADSVSANEKGGALVRILDRLEALEAESAQGSAVCDSYAEEYQRLSDRLEAAERDAARLRDELAAKDARIQRIIDGNRAREAELRSYIR